MKGIGQLIGFVLFIIPAIMWETAKSWFKGKQ